MGKVTISSKTRDEINAEIKGYIRRYITDSLREIQNDGKLKCIESSALNDAGPCIGIQFWYNMSTNKVFIEYDLSWQAEFIYTTKRLKEAFEDKMENNFKYETNIWYEIITPEDGIDEKCDSNANLTPYTIGYWKSISAKYQFLEDKTEVLADAKIIMNPSDEIDKGKPAKRFEEFIDEIGKIRKKYDKVFMTNEEKDQYINAMYKIATIYERDSKEYKDAISSLNNKYGIVVNTNSLIPKMFKEYQSLYYSFFEKELPYDIDNNKVCFYLEIYGTERKEE